MKPMAWVEVHPGIWEAHQNGFDYVVTDDGNMTIHFGEQGEKSRVVLLIESCRKSINDMRQECTLHAAAIDAALAKNDLEETSGDKVLAVGTVIKLNGIPLTLMAQVGVSGDLETALFLERAAKQFAEKHCNSKEKS